MTEKTTLSPEDEAAAICGLLAAHEDATSLLDPPADQALSRSAVYRIQSAVCDRRGPIAGFKTGRQVGEATPVMAPIMANRLYGGGTRIPAAHSRLRGVELEIGFRLISTPPPVDASDFDARMRACSEIVVALEIVESRLRDQDGVHPSWKLADAQVNGGLVIGEVRSLTGAGDLSRRTVRLMADEHVLHEGEAEVPGGDAFDTWLAFVRTVGNHCGGLQVGHVVITGSLTGVDFVAAGQTISGQIHGLGSVDISFA